MSNQTLSNGLSFEMPAGNLGSNETAPPDSVPIGSPYQLPIVASESFGKVSKKKKFLSALFG